MDPVSLTLSSTPSSRMWIKYFFPSLHDPRLLLRYLYRSLRYPPRRCGLPFLPIFPFHPIFFLHFFFIIYFFFLPLLAFSSHLSLSHPLSLPLYLSSLLSLTPLILSFLYLHSLTFLTKNPSISLISPPHFSRQNDDGILNRIETNVLLSETFDFLMKRKKVKKEEKEVVIESAP